MTKKFLKTMKEKNKKEYEKFHNELKALNVTDNVYTKHTPETLNKSYSDLHTALSEKNAAYAAELKKKQENSLIFLSMQGFKYRELMISVFHS